MHSRISNQWTRVAFLLAVPAFAIACTRAEAAPKQEGVETIAKSNITTTDVSERSFPKTLLLTGSLAANQSSSVASDGAGKVTKTFVERGSVVKKGDVLARLDSREASMGAAEASASAETAKTQAREAKLECGRAEKLFAHQVISRAEYDKTMASCDSAGSSVNAASARAARASKEVTDAVIRAPFSGVVVERFVSVGEFVTPGTRVARLVDVDPMRIELEVPEVASGKLSEGQKLAFEVGPLPGESFSATVRFIGPALEDKSRNLSIEAIVDQSDKRLKPGMFTTTRLAVGQSSGLAVPASSIKGDAQSPRVWVLNGDHIEERVLSIGERDSGFVEVKKGVSKGEHVVDKPGSDLRDGLLVQ